MKPVAPFKPEPGGDASGPTADLLSRRKLRWPALFLVALVAIAAGMAAFSGGAGARAVLRWIEQLGPWGPVVYILVYVIATVSLVPGSVLTLGAGALFGTALGFVCASIGSLLGGTCAFLIGRHLARGWVTKQIGGNERWRELDQAVAREGWKIVLLARLSPVFPFTLLNYALGLSRIRIRDYVIASWLGMMPGAWIYVCLGALARTGIHWAGRTREEWLLYGAGLVATVAVTILLARLAQRSLRGRIANGKETR